MQCHYGNHYVQQFLARARPRAAGSVPPMQAKPTLNVPGDRYEQEAAQVAHDVAGTAVPSRSGPSPRGGNQSAPAGLDPAIGAARGSGQPLAEELRTSMEQRIGADFSGVRLHTDARADALSRSIQARAFTSGQDIFFRRDAYQSGSQAGRRLLAHELTHVAQQSQGQATVPGIQREFGDDFPWDGVQSVTRSGSGVEGVWFVKAGNREVIVKFLRTAAGVDQANTILQSVGIATPQSRIVHNSDSDPVGVEVRSVIGRFIANDELQIADVANQEEDDPFRINAGRAKARLNRQLQDYPYIQIQEKVAGTAIDQLDSAQLGDLLSNPGLLEMIGKIALVDAFLGNTDRLSRTKLNAGNYILTLEGTLVAIDNELKAPKLRSKRRRKGELRYILKHAEDLATAFLHRLTSSAPDLDLAADTEDFVKHHIRLGIDDGIAALAQLMHDDPAFIGRAKVTEEVFLPGPQGSHASHREIVRKTLKTRMSAIQKYYRRRKRRARANQFRDK